MKVIGFVTEYNPFHHGHKYHLEESISQTKATHSLAIMSSSFVQRGEPSLVDKWTRAKMAIDNGVDLVIELPFIYSTESAELFSYGAIKLMNSLNIVDYISFGSEIGNINPLSIIADILLEEPKEYKNKLKLFLDQGFSFPHSRSMAVYDYLKSQNSQDLFDYKNILKQSNNILGIEYLKSIYSLNSPIKPFTILRQGSDYKDENLNVQFASATGIRKSIFENGLDSIKQFVPKNTFKLLLDYENKYKKFNRLQNYDRILKYLLLSKEPYELLKYFDVNEGLENRIIKSLEISSNLNMLIKNISTRRYPVTRIQRILTHILLDLEKNTINHLFQRPVPYIRILGSNKKGYEILRKIKDRSSTPIIHRFAEYKKYNSDIINQFIYYEKKATNIFFYGIDDDNPLINMDYKISQYNK